jgi:hypothetical protein
VTDDRSNTSDDTSDDTSDGTSVRASDGTSGDQPAEPTGAGRPVDPARRRRRLLIGGVAAAAVLLVLLGCLAVAGVVRSGIRLADRADRDERRQERLADACLELETRLNRLAPPAATGGDPRGRAAAIRDENAALAPFLSELTELAGERRDPARNPAGQDADDRDADDPDPDDDRHPGDRYRGELARDWQRLVEARTAYANALDRQAADGGPAFFVPPRGGRDGSILPALERRGPQTCAPSVRRLAHPDL